MYSISKMNSVKKERLCHSCNPLVFFRVGICLLLVTVVGIFCAFENIYDCDKMELNTYWRVSFLA